MVFGIFALSVYYICRELTYSMERQMSNKEEPQKLESEIVLKATAALQGEVEQDLKKEDGSLKELIENVESKADEDN